MSSDNKRGNLLIALMIPIAIVAIVAAGLILVKPSFLNTQSPRTEEPTPTVTNTAQTTPTPSSTLTTSPTPIHTNVNSNEIFGILNIVYGDPQPGSGDQQPRYKYSVTDYSGKITTIKIDSSTKYIGGNNIADFDRKKVKIKGILEDSKALTAISIEFL